MKFIPVPMFERINSVTTAVETLLNGVVTVRLEAYTCRYTKEEKQLSAVIGERKQQQQLIGSPASGIVGGGGVATQRSPLLQCSTAPYQHGLFPPSDLSLGDSMGTPQGSNGATPSTTTAPPPSSTAAGDGHANHQPDAVDDRLVFLIAALNAIHGDGFDFSILEEHDFELLDVPYVYNEVNRLLTSLPDSHSAAVIGAAGTGHEPFWQAISDVVTPQGSCVGQSAAEHMASHCDVFMFKCPQCDPIAQKSSWSNHCFLYGRRQRVMVSLLCFGIAPGSDLHLGGHRALSGGGMNAMHTADDEDNSNPPHRDDDFFCEEDDG